MVPDRVSAGGSRRSFGIGGTPFLPRGSGRPRVSRGRALRGRPDSSRSRLAICPSWQVDWDNHAAPPRCPKFLDWRQICRSRIAATTPRRRVPFGLVSPSSMAGVNFSAPSAKRPQQITTCAHALRSRLAATFAASVRRHRRRLSPGMSTSSLPRDHAPSATRAMQCSIRTLWTTTHFAQREQITGPPVLVADHPQDT